jgi:hypothetical protein
MMRTALWALFAVWWLLPAQAFGQDEEIETESRRWAPALAITSGVLVQNVSADVVSSLVRGKSFADPPVQPIRPPICPPDCPPVFSENPVTSGGSRLVPPYVGGDLELMTPGAVSLPGIPRLFAHAGAAAVFSQTLNPAKEGVPEPMRTPPGVGTGITEDTIFGQGSQTSVKNGPLAVTAGAGVAFTIDAFERRIRIKPSVEYLWEELEVSGIVQRAVALTSPAQANGIEDFRLIILRDEETQAFHGVGPGLEIETDAARVGSFMASIFIGAQAYAILGDRRVEFSTSNQVLNNSDVPVEESAAWSVEKDPWAYRAGVGLRLRWAPE